MTSAATVAEPVSRMRIKRSLRRLGAPVLLLMPAIVILVATIAAPLLFSFYSSFTAYRLTRPETLWTFVGWRNYVNVLSDQVFWHAFGRTVLLLTIALNLEMLLGLGLALLVEKATRGQRLLRTDDDVSDDVLPDPGRLPVQVPVQRQRRSRQQRAAI